jgi:hypothetical protein
MTFGNGVSGADRHKNAEKTIHGRCQPETPCAAVMRESFSGACPFRRHRQAYVAPGPVKKTVAVIVTLLILCPLALISYRVLILGYPLFPAAPQKVWQLSFDAQWGVKPSPARLKQDSPLNIRGWLSSGNIGTVRLMVSPWLGWLKPHRRWSGCRT